VVTSVDSNALISKRKRLPPPLVALNKKPKTQKSGEWVLQERVNLETVEVLLKNLPLIHRDRNSLRHILEHTDPVTGLHAVEYYHGGGRDAGRLYGSKSIQRMSGGTRDYLLADTHTDIDIDNCFPVIFHQVCARLNLDADALTGYIKNRKGIFKVIMDRHPELTRGDVKKGLLISLHVGGYKKATRGIRVEELEIFSREMYRLATELSKMEKLAYMWDHVKRNKKKGSLLGSLVSFICQDVEIQLMTVARKHLESVECAVRVNMFDGLLVEELNKTRTLDLTALSVAVEKETKYKVHFTVKPIIAPTLAALCRQVDTLEHKIPEDEELLLFAVDGTIMRDGVSRAGTRELCMEDEDD
jgi:hypothetical protein